MLTPLFSKENKGMKYLWACLLISVTVWAHSQTAAPPADAPHNSIADFELVYPLSDGWVRATQMIRERLPSNPPPNFDVLLAAVYVPKSSISESSPFFSLRAYRQPATDCKKAFEAMIAHSQDRKDHAEGGVQQFSAAGRDYFRVNLAHGIAGRHQCMICTAADGHLLVWNATASNDKGLDTIIATLNSIAPLPQPSDTQSSPSPAAPKPAGAQDEGTNETPPTPRVARPEKVRVSSGVVAGLLIKKVNPSYPADARAARIQGVVIFQAEISKTGDITNLELVEGPIELAGSAVAAVRQWKYRPYLLLGQPVAVATQIQVNYVLSR
jgi:TonB family protein